MQAKQLESDPHYSVGIIGVGNMGGAMAANLLERGWPVSVCDIEPEKVTALVALGATACANGAAIASQSEVVIVCVVDAAQTEDVLFGADGVASTLPAGKTVLLCPTIAPDDVQRFGARLAERGIHTVDAPMSGGPVRAREGTMSLMLAGPNAVLATHQQLIADLSNKVFRISERVGDGARTKLVNNLLAGINLVGAAEAMAMAQAMGLDLATTLNVIEQSSGQSWIGLDRMQRALAGDYAPRAHVTLLEKDTRLGVLAAQAAGFAGPLGARASAVFAQAHAAGLAQEDDAALFKLLSRKG
jgi:3-hydroxyisobutyrate dehydrogenase